MIYFVTFLVVVVILLCLLNFWQASYLDKRIQILLDRSRTD